MVEEKPWCPPNKTVLKPIDAKLHCVISVYLLRGTLISQADMLLTLMQTPHALCSYMAASTMSIQL